MKLAIVTTLWGRRKLSKVVLDYYRQTFPNATLIAVATQEEDIDLARQAGWIPRYERNVPLSHKFNEGFMASRQYDPDAVMVVGSDDLVSVSYVDAALVAMKTIKPRLIAPGGTYFYSPKRGECRYVRAPQGSGAGRVMSRDTLNTVNWKPYSDVDKKYIESGMKRVVGDVDFLVDVSPASGRYVVDVKTRDNLHSYEKMTGSVIDVVVEEDTIVGAFPCLNLLMEEAA